MIEVKKLNFSIENKKIIQDISIKVNQGQFIGVIGANGSGKSTLLKNVYRFLKYDSGNIKLKNVDLYSYSSKSLAKEMAVLAQKQNMNFDFSVEEIVEMGRYAYKHSIFDSEENKNSKFIEDALNAVGMYKMKDRSFLSLSGGEMQRVLIARALAQNTEILILDEPTNHLDSNSLGLLPIIASIVLGQLVHTDIVADNTGVRQIGVGSWAVPWETIERIEILPGGKSWLWGTQPPRLILHIRPDAALGRGTLRRLRRRGRIETRLRPSLIQVFMGLAGQKGIPVEIPQPLPTAPHIEPNVLGPGGSE